VFKQQWETISELERKPFVDQAEADQKRDDRQMFLKLEQKKKKKNAAASWGNVEASSGDDSSTLVSALDRTRVSSPLVSVRV